MRDEHSRFTSMRDAVIKAAPQLMKRPLDARKPRTWTYFSRDSLPLADTWGTDGLTGTDELRIRPFDLHSLAEQHSVATVHDHQVPFIFLISAITDETIK